MMLTAYRLFLKQFRTRAFTGEGARRAGGRWNPPGFPAVYASATLSLATLEFLVHLGSPSDAPELVFFRVEIDRSLVRDVALPRHWKRLRLRDTRALGRTWLESADSPALRVPSFVVPDESNFVLNPSHPLLGQLVISRPRPFVLDPRLHDSG